jgi:hypothetical protein
MTTTIITPNPLNSDMEYNRFHHLDIPNLDDTELVDEINYLRNILWGLPRDDWLRERVRVLGRELAKRRGTKWR